MDKSIEQQITRERRTKIILSYLFMGLFIAFFLLVMSCCIALVDDTFEHFISTTGVFFIPLLASLCALCLITGIGFFRFVTLDHAKKMVMDVQKCNEVSVDGMNKIMVVIDKEKDNELKRKEGIFKEIVKQEHLKEEAKIKLVKELKKDV